MVLLIAIALFAVGILVYGACRTNKLEPEPVFSPY